MHLKSYQNGDYSAELLGYEDKAGAEFFAVYREIDEDGIVKKMKVHKYKRLENAVKKFEEIAELINQKTNTNPDDVVEWSAHIKKNSKEI